MIPAISYRNRSIHAAFQDSQTEYLRAMFLISPYCRVIQRYTPSISKASYPLQSQWNIRLVADQKHRSRECTQCPCQTRDS
jgi:hypothetical protein